ncbi:hypothetical protein CEB3_c28500 [Peptococcaceae bacterium CEB3]|nr:hypothetical protein CEB3_c28500 [Peptococcaceae bacterium CEB3]
MNTEAAPSDGPDVLQHKRKGVEEMAAKNVFREHLRLMSPMELCLCLDNEEMLRGFLTLQPDEQTHFVHEFDRELINVIRRYEGIKTRLQAPARQDVCAV